MTSLYPNLDAAMEARGVSVEDLSRIINSSEEVVHLKLRGVREWSLSEAVMICRHLQYHDLKHLFLR